MRLGESTRSTVFMQPEGIVGELAKKVREAFRQTSPAETRVDQLPADGAGTTLQLLTHNRALARLLTAPPADFLSAEPCPLCSSRERWTWLDGRALCRVCLVLDLAPLTLRRGVRGIDEGAAAI